MALRDRAAARGQPLAQLGLAHQAAQRVAAICPRSSGSTTSAFSPSTATSPTAPARREAISGSPAAAPSRSVDAERLVGAHQRQRVGRRVHAAELAGRGRPREARGHAQPAPPARAARASSGPRAADLELGLALGEAGLGERVDQPSRFLSATSRPTARIRTGPAPSSRPPARSGRRGPRSGSATSTRAGSTPSARSRSTP